MNKFLTFIDGINKILLLLLGVLIGVMIGVLSAQVISRTVFGNSLSWSEELARYIMIYVVFIGAAIALRKQQMIAIEFIAEKVKFQTRRVMKIVVNLIGIMFFSTIFIQGLEVMSRVKLQLSAALQIPMSYVYAALPVGAVLLTINAIAVIIELAKSKSEENIGRVE